MSAWVSLLYLRLVIGDRGLSSGTLDMPSEITYRWRIESLFRSFSCLRVFHAWKRPAGSGVKSLAPTSLNFFTTRSRFLVGCWRVYALEP